MDRSAYKEWQPAGYSGGGMPIAVPRVFVRPNGGELITGSIPVVISPAEEREHESARVEPPVSIAGTAFWAMLIVSILGIGITAAVEIRMPKTTAAQMPLETSAIEPAPAPIPAPVLAPVAEVAPIVAPAQLVVTKAPIKITRPAKPSPPVTSRVTPKKTSNKDVLDALQQAQLESNF
jgi:hypothetical protein